MKRATQRGWLSDLSLLRGLDLNTKPHSASRFSHGGLVVTKRSHLARSRESAQSRSHRQVMPHSRDIRSSRTIASLESGELVSEFRKESCVGLRISGAA
jgi:hypothetical protein